MNLEINSIKHNLLTLLGSLSDKKIEKLDNLLLEMYPEKQSPVDGVLIYLNPDKHSFIVFSPNQISFVLEGTGLKNYNEVIDSWEELSNKILDMFLMENECKAYEIDLGGLAKTIDGKNKSAANKSIKDFINIHHEELKKIGEPVAVGFRYVFNKNDFIYDCKVEPLLSNLSQFLFTMNVKGNNGKYSVKDTFDNLKDNIIFFNGQWFTLVKDKVLI